MQINPVYPTEFQTYDAAIKEAYGDFALIDNNEKLVEGTLFTKRYFHLFPRLASAQIQQLTIAAEQKLLETLGKSFSDMVLPMQVHHKLYGITSREELSQITESICSALDQGYWDQYPNDPPIPTSESWLKGYRKLLMPFSFEPIPSGLIDTVKHGVKEMENQILQLADSQYQSYTVDLFWLSIGENAEEYYRNRLPHLLSVYPVFPEGKAASVSEWGPVLAVKWYEVIQEYIRTIEESQYKKEPFLQQVLLQKAISLESFMALGVEKTALMLQTEAEQAYLKSIEEVKAKGSKDRDAGYTKLIPWLRGEKNLQALWSILTENGYIEHEESELHFMGHFYLVDKPSRDDRLAVIQKIAWTSSLNNLIRMVESLHTNNIISIKPFNKKANTKDAGKIHNLIYCHFCRPNSEEITLDSIRQAAHRMTPGSKVDIGFNSTVLKLIRSIH